MTKVRQAVVMVGGFGKRLQPLTNHCPKPILPVLDKPCMRYLLESLAGSGIEEIILACGYRSSQLVDAIGDGSDMGITIDYSYEDEPRGTAGAMKMLERRLDGVFVAANGDVFADISPKEQIETHFSSKAGVTIALTEVKDFTQYGIAELDDGERIVKFIEKPQTREEAPTDLANAGVYVMNKSVLAYVPENKFFDFSKDLMPILLAEKKKVQGFGLKGHWRDVGRPEDLLGANLDMASALHGQMKWEGSRTENTSIKKSFYLGKGASVTGSDISDAVVMMNSAVTDSKLTRALVMSDCKICSAKIENSIIGAGSRIGRGAEIINSVIGYGIEVPAGRKIIGEKV